MANPVAYGQFQKPETITKREFILWIIFIMSFFVSASHGCYQCEETEREKVKAGLIPTAGTTSGWTK